MRRQHDQDFLIRDLFADVRRQILPKWNLRNAGYPIQVLRGVALDQAAENADLAVLEANIVFDLALADDGLLDAADGALAGNRGNVHGELHADVAVRVHARGYVDI